jgi:hypothetical protein
MADSLFCMQCQRPLDERQLRMKSLTTESCPFCGTMVRQSEGMRATNLDASIMEDVVAIDTWFEDHARATGLAVRKHPAEHGKYEWSVETKAPWVCEVAYSSDRTSILEFRLCSTENGDAIVEEPRKLQTICARYGCQPHGNRHTDGMTGTTTCEWGVVQYLSTSTLCEELFAAITAKLGEAMNAVKQAFSGQAL